MLRVLGSNKVFCDGLTRRDLLHVGALAPLGLSLAELVARGRTRHAPPTASGFGSAKRCILLYLWGSPSQIDTFDPKPDAPAEVRGALGSIPTALPGRARRRDAAADRQAARPRHGAAVADAPGPDPRDRVRLHRGADDRPPAGRQRPRPAALAVHRLGGRLPRRARRPEAARGAAKLLAAVPVRLEARPVAARAVRRVPRPGLRHRLVRVPREGHARGAPRLRRPEHAHADGRRPVPRHPPDRPVRDGRPGRHGHARPAQRPRVAARSARCRPAHARREGARRRSTGTARWPARCSRPASCATRSTCSASRRRCASATG